MLEERIVELTAAVKELTAAMRHIEDIADAQNPATVENVKKASKKTKKKKDPIETKVTIDEGETPPVAVDDGPITEQDLINLCLAIVRENPKAKKKIKKVISKHGGELIKDIDPENYPALHSDLEGLKNG